MSQHDTPEEWSVDKGTIFMFALKKFASLAMVCALAVSASAFGADDDVFLDEGNGDFDQMPIAPEQPAVAEQPQAAPAPEAAPAEPMPMLAEEPESMPGMETPAVAETPKKKAKKEKVARQEEPPPAPRAKKTAKKSVAAAGQFVVTKDSCPMMRSPASTSETMLTVKPARKIWVEDAGQGWVKGWNKAGEEGFIAKDCVE